MRFAGRMDWWLTAVIVVHVGLGVVYMRATPIFEAPDEGYHVAVVRWLGQGRGLPVQQVDQPADFAQEGSQPPLYYALAAGLTFWIDTSDWDSLFVSNPFSRIGIPGTSHNVNYYRHPIEASPASGTTRLVQAVRLLSLLLSVPTIWLTHRLALATFPDDRRLALVAAGLVAFNPKVLFINAAANNDNLLMLLGAATLLLLLTPTASQSIVSWRRAAALGGLLGLAALTKVSGLVLWPIVGLGLLRPLARADRGRWIGNRQALPTVLARLAVVIGVALAISGWWFIRNWQLYGDWLGLNMMIAIIGPRTEAVPLLDLIAQEWHGFYLSFWEVFGVFTIRAAGWTAFVFNAISLGAIAGGLAWLWRRRGRLPLPAYLLALFCVLTLAGVIQWTSRTPASQGRLLFGAIAPLATLMAGGLMAPLPDRLRRWAPGVVLGGLLAAAIYIPLADIAPKYAPPRRLAETDLPADLRPVHAGFDGVLELIGYTADESPRLPGEAVKLTLFWRVLQATDRDYALALHLLGRDALEIGKLDTWPGGGRAPTSQLPPGMIFADEYQLPIIAGAEAPTLIRLAVSFWDGDPSNVRPISTPDGDQLRAVTIRVGRLASRQPADSPQHADGSTFEHGIRLIGVDAALDDTLRLGLHWQTDRSVPADFTVFLHVVDPAGVSVRQADAPPLQGDWPTSAWLPHQSFIDTRQIALPGDLPPGLYGLRLGLYDPASGARVSAFRPDGAAWPDDTVVMPALFAVK